MLAIDSLMSQASSSNRYDDDDGLGLNRMTEVSLLKPNVECIYLKILAFCDLSSHMHA